MKSLSELIQIDEPAWPEIKAMAKDAGERIELLPPDPVARKEAIVSVQSSLRSYLGAIVYETGGILVDCGWLRILGSGHPRLPRPIHRWNAEAVKAFGEDPGLLLVADDVMGGFFALDGGGLGAGDGSVYYHSPDSLSWEPMKVPYSKFLSWALHAELTQFYESMRWKGWQSEAQRINGGQSLSTYPPLWTKEGKDIARTSRKAVPVNEVFMLNLIVLPKQLGEDKA